MNKQTFKSIGAVLAGMIIGIALSLLTDTILEQLKIFPPIGQVTFSPWMLVLATIYRTVYTSLGGFVTAKLAPANPMRHVRVLAWLAVVANAAGLLGTGERAWGRNGILLH